RMNDLSVQYNNGTQNADSQAALAAEFGQLQDESGRIEDNTKFNGNLLVDGATDRVVQVGYASTDPITIEGATPLNPVKADIAALQINEAVTATPGSGASNKVQAQITAISEQRGELGAVQNRFEHTINNVNVAIENLSAAESRIR